MLDTLLCVSVSQDRVLSKLPTCLVQIGVMITSVILLKSCAIGRQGEFLRKAAMPSRPPSRTYLTISTRLQVKGQRYQYNALTCSDLNCSKL